MPNKSKCNTFGITATIIDRRVYGLAIAIATATRCDCSIAHVWRSMR